MPDIGDVTAELAARHYAAATAAVNAGAGGTHWTRGPCRDCGQPGILHIPRTDVRCDPCFDRYVLAAVPEEVGYIWPSHAWK